jgi:hypothetical protein
VTKTGPFGEPLVGIDDGDAACAVNVARQVLLVTEPSLQLESPLQPETT